MSDGKLIYGTTKNNIPFARLEGGPKTAMLWGGGPGNTLPSGWLLNSFIKPLFPLLEEYSLVMLGRRVGMPEGHSTRDMSDDYATLIEAEYDGRVDLILGTSYGGIVAQYFAADHAEHHVRSRIELLRSRRRDGWADRRAAA